MSAVDRFATITELGAALRSGATTSVALTEATISAADALDDRLGVYLARYDDAALEAAATADRELASGNDRGPLHGIPLGVKDIISMRDGPTTAQSLVLPATWGDRRDAPVVARLRDAGAVLTGKTTTMEFAIGAPDRSKPFPLPRNPWDTECWTGGSSSGTGGGIAAGLFVAGLGSDTGGSIRIPAAYCGVTGHKQTFGLVPKSGVVPLGFTYDHVGPLARSAEDCALLLDVLVGPADDDPTTVDVGEFRCTPGIHDGIAGLRIGVARSVTVDGGYCDPGTAREFDAATRALAAAGAVVGDIEFPLWDELHDACFLGLYAEAFAWHRPHLARAWDDYGFDTRLGIAQGALVTGGDYVQLQRVREIGRSAVAALFREVDLLVMPTTGRPAPRFGAPGMDRDQRLRSLYTPPFNALGLPALSVPMGFVDGLPVGLQIVGPAFADPLVLRAGVAFQTQTDWHRRVPDVAAAI
jgi:aspartyl-tRNA(Asn)/glutamyl-tRNA(Gln) amidotransferase subunit A